MKYRSHLYDIFFVFYQMKYLTDVVESFIIGEQRQGTASINRRLPNHIRMEKGDFT